MLLRYRLALPCAAASAAVLLAACSLINTFEDPPAATGQAGGGAGLAGGSGPAGSGPVGGSGPAGSGPAGGTHAGGTGPGGTGGSGGGPPCTLGVGDCGAGMKCSVVDIFTGATGCVVAGPLPPWTRCAEDTDCAAFSWCDLPSYVCKPLCETSTDCDQGASCLPAKRPDEVEIPGLQLCTAHCHPESAAPCSQDNGPTNCVWQEPGGDFDCVESSNIAEGNPCQSSQNCGAGLVCVGSECHRWCSPVGYNSNCLLSFYQCNPLSPGAYYDGLEFGAC